MLPTSGSVDNMINIHHQSTMLRQPSVMEPLSAAEVVVHTTTSPEQSLISPKDPRTILTRSLPRNIGHQNLSSLAQEPNQVLPTVLKHAELQAQGVQIRPLKSHGHQRPEAPQTLGVGDVTTQWRQRQAAAIPRSSQTSQDSLDGKPWRPMNTMKRKLTNCSTFSRNVLETAQLNGEDAEGETVAKKTKPNLVKPKFDVKYAEHLVHIGNARYVIYGEVDNEAMLRLQECDYKPYRGGEKPQPKMIRFTLQQWIDLTTLVPTIDDAIEEYDEVKHHLGRNTYIRVQPHRRRVDIRDFFLPNGPTSLDILPSQFEQALIPTRRGLSLTYEEWHELVSRAIPLIKHGAEKIQVASPESCVGQHRSQKEWLMCTHCNPNGYTVWL
jgi:hypothetical protein